MDLPAAIASVLDLRDLSREEMLDVMRAIMSGQATDAQIGGFLIGLRMKGESVEEIIAAASVMRELATKVNTSSTFLVDTCGTGGSGSNKFNVSTASAFVAAAAGARVAKHGNRSASSKSGSADVLEAAGAKIHLSSDQVGLCIDNVGVGFLFAQSHHSAMKHAIGPRKEMIARTLFNLLGPLTNPADARRQLIGVYDRKWVRPIAEVLRKLGSEHVIVVHSGDGLDEISISDASFIAELSGGEINEYTVCPEDFGLQRSPLSELVIEDSSSSLLMLQKSLVGTHEGARNIVMLNAGAAIYVAGVCSSLAEGVALAGDAIDSGMAVEKFKTFTQFTQKVKA
ncbi:MAG: anthranilate phosphoribosyltransferase [Pseudomonadales bacterium]|nr:anthranilate phosphoribosyltransferase [Pseudomonadales bacterium]